MHRNVSRQVGASGDWRFVGRVLEGWGRVLGGEGVGLPA